jgi:hypothetical protein
VLFRGDADGTGAFFALAYLILDLLAFLEVAGVSLNLGMMDEQFLAAIIRNYEPETLFHVKPLYCTCTHLCSFWPPKAITKLYVSHFVFERILLRDVRIYSMGSYITINAAQNPDKNK